MPQTAEDFQIELQNLISEALAAGVEAEDLKMVLDGASDALAAQAVDDGDETVNGE